MTDFWICGKSLGIEDAWEFIGLFSTREKAVAACDDEAYFIAPAKLDEALREGEEWPGILFPNLK